MALEVRLVTPEQEVWSGEARMVVARGTEGEVGIMAGHAPMLIRLAIAPMRIQRPDEGWEAAVIDGGFLHVTGEEGTTRVDVLAAYAEMAGEIDLAAAKARVEEMRRRVQELGDVEARAELAKALARVDLHS